MGRMKRLSEIKILIIGHSRHGKDTVAEILRDTVGLSFESSSLAACELFIFDTLKNTYGYINSDDCFNDRHNHRVEWHELIADFNKEDKTRLARYILSSSNTYVGMRATLEVQACIDAGLFNVIIWVDANKRLPRESKDSNKVTEKFATYVIDNNGTEADLHRNTRNTLGKIFYEL
jgi:hypothetical protein